MENSDLGPRPVTPPTGRALSRSRAALLETLRGEREAVGLNELVVATGLHRNTVREHLDVLLDDGLVERRRAPAVGRGRPAWLYRATDGAGSGVGHEYAGLATALASLVARTSSSPAEDAAIAGAEWGRRWPGRSTPRGPPLLPAPVGR